MLGLVFFVHATPYEKVDSFVRQLAFSPSTLTEYDSMVAIFNQQFHAEDEKVRAVYFWVTENISYDAQGLFRGNRIDEKAGALKYKRCVCAGYADLLDHAFRKLGLQSKYLTGRVRMLDGNAQWDPASWKSGHAWNAVNVNNEWKLIDATWASGYLRGDHFEKERDDGWFFMPPENFLLSHFPDKPEYQFTEKTKTEEEFYQQAFSLWEFAQARIISFSHHDLQITGEPGDAKLMWVEASRQISHVIISSQDGRTVKLLPVFEKEGKYYWKYIVGSVRTGSYYVGFMFIDANRKCVWRSDHVLGYFFSFVDPQQRPPSSY